MGWGLLCQYLGLLIIMVLLFGTLQLHYTESWISQTVMKVECDLFLITTVNERVILWTFPSLADILCMQLACWFIFSTFFFRYFIKNVILGLWHDSIVYQQAVSYSCSLTTLLSHPCICCFTWLLLFMFCVVLCYFVSYAITQHRIYHLGFHSIICDMVVIQD